MFKECNDKVFKWIVISSGNGKLNQKKALNNTCFEEMINYCIIQRNHK